MRLSSLISSNLDAILIDWVAFARSQLPAAATMDEAALLDHDQFARDTELRLPGFSLRKGKSLQ